MNSYERLRKIREELALSQEEFAEILGLKQGSYSDIERGKTKNISGPILKIIEFLYGYNPIWILTGEGEETIKNNLNILGNNNTSSNQSWAVSGGINLSSGPSCHTEKIISKSGIKVQREYESKEILRLTERITDLETEIRNLNVLIESKNEIIKSKDEIIDLLRSIKNR